MSYTRINGMRSARYPLQGCSACGVGQTHNPFQRSAPSTYATTRTASYSPPVKSRYAAASQTSRSMGADVAEAAGGAAVVTVIVVGLIAAIVLKSPKKV